ncbi:unnamed protein product [Lactuca virosa]|uniref:Uncharacterized protein n=1 Tax=Lactuca virosa TaxID=75947 RepID=A0AAU9PN57_9ASTR|nr:unnamed protein product [Lactuca virosa]
MIMDWIKLKKNQMQNIGLLLFENTIENQRKRSNWKKEAIHMKMAWYNLRIWYTCGLPPSSFGAHGPANSNVNAVASSSVHATIICTSSVHSPPTQG